MKKMILTTIIVLFSMSSFVAEAKALIVYYTKSGNTEILAKEIQKEIGADIFKIEVVNSYPEDYRKTTEVVKEEQSRGYLPPIKEKVENLADYDTVYLGSPIWWGTYANPVATFLNENDLSNKRVVLFITHGGSGVAKSLSDLRKIQLNAEVEANVFSSKNVNTARIASDIKEWLNEINNKKLSTVQ